MVGRTKCLLPICIDSTSISSRRRLWTPELSSLLINNVSDIPYSKTASIINDLQHRNGDSKLSEVTLNECVMSWGDKIYQNQLHQAEEALSSYGFDPKTGLLRPGEELATSITNPVFNEEETKRTLDDFNSKLYEYKNKYPDTPIDIGEALSSLECPNNTTILMIDDIGVKRQKEKRSINNNEGYKSAKTVINTVVWIRSSEGTYTIAAENTKQGLIMGLGFMLKNKLLENRQLIIFFDGAKEIRNYAREIYSFHKPLKLYLDWYHVYRRIAENLSMALKCGKENRERNQKYLEEIMRKIWFNQIDKAIDILYSIDSSIIRNIKKINDTIDYLNNRRPYLYNYAVRKIVGLINSSNRVEDMNNQVVARRQKKKGMSWSVSGSRGLAHLETLRVNNEISEWIHYGNIPFKLTIL